MNDAQLKTYLNKCVRCGQCRSVCPVFEVLGEEGAAPRGKVFIASLLFSGELARPGEANHYLSLCLQCRRCSAQCPSGVPVHHIISEARKLLSRPWQHLLYDHFLASTPARTHAARLFQLAEHCGLKKLAINLGMLPPWVKNISVVQKDLPEFTPSRGTSKGTITYYPGCAATYIFPEVAKACITVLSHLGWNVIVPQNLTCCGFPHEAAGSKKAVKLQKENYTVLQKTNPDVIITSCPSCALAIKNSPGAQNRSTPVKEITEFLAERDIKINEAKGPYRQVTYHQPCHSSPAVLKYLLEKLPRVEIIPWEMEATCCGGGGIFMFLKPGISSLILQPKTTALKKTGAKNIVTNCPACTLQLQRGLWGTGIKVIHPVEIISSLLTGQP